MNNNEVEWFNVLSRGYFLDGDLWRLGEALNTLRPILNNYNVSDTYILIDYAYWDKFMVDFKRALLNNTVTSRMLDEYICLVLSKWKSLK